MKHLYNRDLLIAANARFESAKDILRLACRDIGACEVGEDDIKEAFCELKHIFNRLETSHFQGRIKKAIATLEAEPTPGSDE